MTLAKFLDECYMFCGLCILMLVNLKHAFACSATILVYWFGPFFYFNLLLQLLSGYFLYSNSFKENQQNALEDYISTSVMLQYNSK